MLFLLPALPLSGFLILFFFSGFLCRRLIAIIGVGSIFLSFLATMFLILNLGIPTESSALKEILWSFIPPMNIGFHFDTISCLMSIVVTLISSLVALYSVQFMEEDADIGRYFACIDLFVCAMLILVLADNLLLLFAGWEGVGLCSYLLIGFWYQKAGAREAATKAFITTRIGDVFLLLGMALIFFCFNTLEISVFLSMAPKFAVEHQSLITLAAILLLAGAVGKSAQIPLQVWLPDAMIGPTPVSALIHAATMVTAGVYLLARTFTLISLAPMAQELILFVGAFTMILGSLSALFQNDLKKVLAYSTMSQIGLMFMALGLGSPSSAMFHFTTHAFFKALLFLSAGVIGLSLHHQYDMRKMGGLVRVMPFTFIVFIIGSGALSALPFLTAGFFSKELILIEAYHNNLFHWGIGILGAFLTSLYTFRMVAMVFFGQQKHHISFRPSWVIKIPLVVLAFATIALGFFETSLLSFLGHIHKSSSKTLVLSAALATVIGMLCAFVIHNAFNNKFIAKGCGFDALYQAIIVRPYNAIAHLLKRDPLVRIYRALYSFILFMHVLLYRSQTGRLRHYLTVIIASAIAVMGLMVLS